MNEAGNEKLAEQSNARFNGIAALTKENPTKSNAIEIPSISLPKRGGALKGIDEKFQVNAANGTARYSIPLPVSPGRNGFTPSLSLSYSSGSGNSPFGLGWDIGSSAIQRKTDKKLPRYRDTFEEDTFMFSGVEDLVPYFYEENVATIYDRSITCRIADPEDETRIFKWLPEFSYDDKGNWISYVYKEDSNKKQEQRDHIPDELHEQNRNNGNALYVYLYLKRIQYGNRKPYYADISKPFDPQEPDDKEHFFEVVFDYGEHDRDKPLPLETNVNGWKFTDDAFSNFHAGFEIRTTRLCKRVLIFHHFENEKQPDGSVFGKDYLVRSLDLDYELSLINDSKTNEVTYPASEVTYLTSVTQSGYIRKQGGFYSKKSLPSLEFQYQQLSWNKDIKEVCEDSKINDPVGLTNNYQWVDFYGEGAAGIFTEQDEGWYYKSNSGIDETGKLQLAPAKMIAPKPSFTGIGTGVLQLQDLEANGEKQVVINAPGVKGFFQLTDDNNWEPFPSFLYEANLDLRDPYVRTIDLNGDGMAELVVTEENVFVWYAADGKNR